MKIIQSTVILLLVLTSFIAFGKKESTMNFDVKHISITINRSQPDVYDFASNPENMPKWAAGLSGTIKKEGDHWISVSPMGKVKVTFAEKNKFGVIDHDVTLENSLVVHNPLRVMKNNMGSEVVFTLFRLPGVSDKDYERDAGMVIKDLEKLKSILEQK
jgi:hypothetical protein